MRFQITLTTPNGPTTVLATCKRPSAAQGLFDSTCIEQQLWMKSKAEKGVRVVTGHGDTPNTHVIVMLTPDGMVLARRTVALVDTRPASVPDPLEDQLVASLIAVSAGAL